jgi:hypothetical protein
VKILVNNKSKRGLKMEKYKIELIGSQVVTIGENNNLENINLNMGTKAGTIDLQKLRDELALLEKSLRQKENKSADEKILLADIIDISESAEDGTVEKVIEELKAKATKLFLSATSGVGTGIIANIISKALGI